MCIGSICCSIAKARGSCQCPPAGFSLLPATVLEPVGTIDMNEMSSILLDKLEEMEDDSADLNLADYTSRLYKKKDVDYLLALTEVNKIVFVAEDMDCDDFAGILYGEFCKQKAFPGGIIDSHVHRLNWFIDENKTFWFIEPQTSQISRQLDGWQGSDIKFFLS